MTNDGFVDFVLDQLAGIPVRAKRMFGGYGLYSEHIFFGIIADGILYFKTDEKTREHYKKEGMRPFSPNEKQTLITYYEVPGTILEDRETLKEWAEQAIRVASNQT